MPYLKVIQKSLPTADTSVGRVTAMHEGKHYDIGEFVGEGMVTLNAAGEKLLAGIAEAKKSKKAEPVADTASGPDAIE